MPGGKTTNVNFILVRKAIKAATALTMREFVTEKLKDKYSSFMYRFRVGKLSLTEYHTICFYAGKAFEDLWPNPHVPQARKINLKLQTLPPTTTHPEVTLKQAAAMAPTFSEQEYATVSHAAPGDEGTQKKGEEPPRPAFVDPYEGLTSPDL